MQHAGMPRESGVLAQPTRRRPQPKLLELTLIGVAACILFTVTSGGFVRLAMVDVTQGVIVAASLVLVGYWLRERRLLTWTKTPLMFEDEFPDQPLQLQL